MQPDQAVEGLFLHVQNVVVTEGENLEEGELSERSVLHSREVVEAQVQRAEGGGEKLEEGAGDATEIIVADIQNLRIIERTCIQDSFRLA